MKIVLIVYKKVNHIYIRFVFLPLFDIHQVSRDFFWELYLLSR